MMRAGKEGLKVIAVEDEAMVLLLLQEMLAEMGHDVVGSASRLEAALRLATEGTFDLAILDVNLCGKRIDPVADVVAGRGLPIVFATGYGSAFPADRWSGQVLSKPYQPEGLQRALDAARASNAA